MTAVTGLKDVGILWLSDFFFQFCSAKITKRGQTKPTSVQGDPLAAFVDFVNLASDK